MRLRIWILRLVYACSLALTIIYLFGFMTIQYEVPVEFKHQEYLIKNSLQRIENNSVNPWHTIPDFVFYLRLTSIHERWRYEFKNVLVRSMRIFVPSDGAKLVVVLDDEKVQDHKFGERVKGEWPFPEICYRKPGNTKIYSGNGKARMYWDMMYPDHCTNATYVGFIDSDTFFSTLVTPQLLFEDSKPVIVAKIGLEPYSCWVDTTRNFLRKKEVMQCMSVFPVMIKTKHLAEMREFLSKERGVSFDELFRDSAYGKNPMCICQFSLMCNYVWYYHRSEYSWHLQMVPNGRWNGEGRHSNQVSMEYYGNEVKPQMTVPIPRSSIHLRYTITNGKILYGQEPDKNTIEGFIKEGLCYSGGFEYCPKKCKKWSRAKVHYNLFSFEAYQWFWDRRCKLQQEWHYKNVRHLIRYYTMHNMEIFGKSSVTKMCDLI